MLPASLIFCALFAFDLSLASVTVETEGGVEPGFKGAVRRKRQACEHGTYQHNNRDCCMCGAGQFLKTHCATSVNDGKCELCPSGTYSSGPSSAEKCEPCTSCDHVNVNLEVHEACSPAKDTTCKCKENHFCSGGTEANCNLCNPCKVCDGGVEVPCTYTSDAVCKDKSEGGNLAVIIPIVVVVLLIIASGAGVYFIRRRRQGMQQLNINANGDANQMEMMQPLKGVDSTHMQDIAEVLGWMDMKAVARSTGMNETAIENCQLDHPGNAQEQTFKLLQIWVEQQSKDAPEKLIKILKEKGKREKAERITALLTGN